MGSRKIYNPNCRRNQDKTASKNYLGRCINFEKMQRFSYNVRLDSLISNKNRKVVRNEVENPVPRFRNSTYISYENSQRDEHSFTFDEWCKIRKKKIPEIMNVIK